MALLAERKKPGMKLLSLNTAVFPESRNMWKSFWKTPPYQCFQLPEDRSGCVQQGLFFCSAAEKVVLEKMEVLRNFELNPLHEMAQGDRAEPGRGFLPRALGSLPPEIVRSSGIRRGEGVFVVPREFFTRLPERGGVFSNPFMNPCWRSGMA